MPSLPVREFRGEVPGKNGVKTAVPSGQHLGLHPAQTSLCPSHHQLRSIQPILCRGLDTETCNSTPKILVISFVERCLFSLVFLSSFSRDRKTTNSEISGYRPILVFRFTRIRCGQYCLWPALPTATRDRFLVVSRRTTSFPPDDQRK